ncbi:hypothetical protein BH20VER1_BH20VER1_03660 [soil metagenome]
MSERIFSRKRGTLSRHDDVASRSAASHQWFQSRGWLCSRQSWSRCSAPGSLQLPRKLSGFEAAGDQHLDVLFNDAAARADGGKLSAYRAAQPERCRVVVCVQLSHEPTPQGSRLPERDFTSDTSVVLKLPLAFTSARKFDAPVVWPLCDFTRLMSRGHRSGGAVALDGLEAASSRVLSRRGTRRSLLLRWPRRGRARGRSDPGTSAPRSSRRL